MSPSEDTTGGYLGLLPTEATANASFASAPPGTIWYDGAHRARSEVVTRVERDAITFLAGLQQRALQESAAPWACLLDVVVASEEGADGQVRDVLASEICELRWTTDPALLIQIVASEHQHLLEHVGQSLSEMPWCVEAKVWPATHESATAGKIVARIGTLDRALSSRLEQAIHRTTVRAKSEAEKGVGGLLAVVFPTISTAIGSALELTLQLLTVYEQLQLHRLTETRSASAPPTVF